MRRTTATRIASTFELHGQPRSLSAVVAANNIKRILQQIFLFKSLSEKEIDSTVRSFSERTYSENEFVVKKGDMASHFFLIRDGSITVRDGDKVIRSLGKWDYFGERGLLLSERRSADCQASSGRVDCLVLDAEVFLRIVGTFKNALMHRIKLQDDNITLKDLVSKYVVGSGTFGQVKLVHHRNDATQQYALKAVKKDHVVRMQQVKPIQVERDVMLQCYHPCIVQAIKTFKDDEHVYFLTEFLGGGDLFFTIREIGMLSLFQSQFYSASIITAISYLHAARRT